MNCWRLYSALHEQTIPTRPEISCSLAAARLFATSLILQPTVEGAREQILSDRHGSESFFEVADDAMQEMEEASPMPVLRSDGQHEPFLLLASMVLNHLDALELKFPEAFD